MYTGVEQLGKWMAADGGSQGSFLLLELEVTDKQEAKMIHVRVGDISMNV